MFLSKVFAIALAAANFVFAALMQGIWFFSYWRDSAPVVLQDELLFSYLAIAEAGSSPYSNSAFSAIFSLASSCGPDFLTCGRIINIFLWLIFAALISIIIYLSKSLPVAIFGFWVSTSSISFFSVTFLPEIMYYVLASIALYLMTTKASSTSFTSLASLFSGLIFGFALLTKPHTFFVLVIATVATLIIYFLEGRTNPLRLIQGFLPITFALLTRTIMELLFSSRNVSEIFGSYLGGGDPVPGFSVSLPIKEPSSDGRGATTLLDALAATFVPYFTVALFFYLPPLIMALFFAAQEKQAIRFETVRLFIVSSVALGMLVVSYGFGAYVTLQGDDHTDRLLLRYSEFLVPLSWLFLIWALSNKAVYRNQWLAGAIPFIIGVSFVVFGGLGSITFVSSDSLILFSFLGSNVWFALFVVGVLGIFVRASLDSSRLYVSFVVLATVALTVTSYQQIYRQSAFHLADAENWSPISMALQNLDSKEVFFLGSKRATIASIMLNSGSLNSKYALINGYSEVPPEWIDEHDFAVISSEIYPPRDSREIVSSKDGSVTLYELRSGRGIEQDLYLESSHVGSFSNIGVVTDWGYWVDGNRSEIVFRNKLEPGDRVIIEIIRHQLTTDPSLVFGAFGEKPLVVELPVAGRLYEVEITVGADGMEGFSLEFDEAVPIAFVEGMETYSFGVGKINTVQ